ncbi:universal stress protein [Rhizobacter sp. SG703]|uniref:universal stress protein n=1 Tax=Rhizobacter sp. SG703 TaxID=2587140 RepID=UPI00144654CB|nr:universal stress protein [Rhizobacter sp. SG703]NKI94270.1 nucleotide-binding universal stress UspA family protein [Rhizobacter sp. SG703]
MYQRILVPVDGSDTSNHGLDEAVQLAKLTHAKLRLVHMVDELSFATGFGGYAGDVAAVMKNAGNAVLAQGAARAKAAGVEAETALFETMSNRLADVVVDEIGRWPADVVVLGTHGRRGVGRWLLGSDAEQILRSSPVPVLLVRPPAD